jgi:glutaredoxin 2
MLNAGSASDAIFSYFSLKFKERSALNCQNKFTLNKTSLNCVNNAQHSVALKIKERKNALLSFTDELIIFILLQGRLKCCIKIFFNQCVNTYYKNL